MTRRNPTPTGLAIAGAIILFSSTLLVFVSYLLLSNLEVNGPILLALSGTIGLVGYFVTKIILNRFIYRKIKLIYKTINAQKLSKGKVATAIMGVGDNVLDNVKEEVDTWITENNAEIARLQELESYRKEFLGNVFHEIKTPVFSVQGYLHTLQDGAFNDPAVNKTYLAKATKNIDRLDEIVKDLELIALRENNALVLEFTSFDLTELVKDVFEALEMQAKEFNATLAIKPGCDTPFAVNADKERIRQVLINLANNAIKYGKEGGLVEVGIYEMGDQILTEITDEGEGIAQEELPRLFERFYRTDKSRVRGKTGGSGLGLAIVKHIVESHNQQITLRSKEGVGSTFGFTLNGA